MWIIIKVGYPHVINKDFIMLYLHNPQEPRNYIDLTVYIILVNYVCYIKCNISTPYK